MRSHRLDEREEASKIYWLIVKHDGLGRRVFTTRLTGSEEVLPIFGHAEEAGEFLRLGKLENGWRVRGTGVGELVSVLLGLCANVRRVALDPMPETDADAGILASFVSMGGKTSWSSSRATSGSRSEDRMKRVLIIENQAAFREALAKLLENAADFEVAGQAGSLAQGHDLALDGLGKLDAAVVCLLLPDDNWTNFIRELRAAEPDLPVLVLTMTQDPEVHARVLEAGVDEVLTKAVSLEEIFATIRRLGDV